MTVFVRAISGFARMLDRRLEVRGVDRQQVHERVGISASLRPSCRARQQRQRSRRRNEIDETKSDMASAIQSLKDHLIPQVKQAPGFVSGTWFGNDSTGHSVVLFDTEEQASQATQEVESTPAEGVRVVSSDVYELHARA